MGRVSESRYTVSAGWDHVPHLDEDTKRKLLASIQPHLREARRNGTPSLGSGAVYQLAVEEVTCTPFAIPPHWRKMYGMDVGWNRTAVAWLAEDPDTGLLYAYAEHYKGQAVPLVHAAAIKMRGDWIHGAIDPASRGRSQVDGRQLIAEYEQAGLHISPAINSVEAGILEVWTLLETGKLKLFSSLQNLIAEYRVYRRDEKGRIVKENDHLMDALRYAVMSFYALAKRKPLDGQAITAPRAADPTAGY